jgi:hypothetical protein
MYRTTASYRSSRLTFKAAVIEPLAGDEAFDVETPHGTFRLTKPEFYKTFPNVVNSKSYNEHGSYNYPRVPGKATPYLLS